MKNIDWGKIRLFYKVAVSGSVSETANDEKVAQSSISRQILKLEKEMGFKLFNRTKKQMMLTKHGEMLFRFAQQMTHSADSIARYMQTSPDTAEGTIKILTSHALASWIMPMLKDFFDQYPKIRLNIVCDELFKSFEDIDVVIGAFIKNEMEITHKHLKSFRTNLFASPSYLKKHGVPKTVQDLDHHRLITFNQVPIPGLGMGWALNIGREFTHARTPFLEVGSTSLILIKAAEQGLGIIELGEDHPRLDGLDLVPVLEHIKGPEVPIYFIYPNHFKDLKRIRVLEGYLNEQIKQHNY